MIAEVREKKKKADLSKSGAKACGVAERKMAPSFLEAGCKILTV